MNLSQQTASLAGTPLVGSRLAALQAEVARGGTGLRFSQHELESDYQRDRASGCAAQARGGLVLSTLITLLFLLLDYLALGKHFPPQATGRLLLIVGTTFLVAWLAMRWQLCKPWIVPINIAAMVIAGLAFAWTIPFMVITADRPPYGSEALLLYVAVVYFLSGAMFHAATCIALGMSVVFIAAIALSRVEPGVVVYSSFFLVALNMVCAIGRYMLDKTYRRNFLTRMIAVELGERDALTGIYNRRVFEDRLDLLLRQSRRERLSLTVLVLDIDYFKRVNDHGGHALGDRALRALAQALQSIARRPLDSVARLGGDEFAALWMGLDGAEIDGRVAELNRSFTEHSAAAAAGLDTPITLSIGVAHVAETEGRDRETLLRAADEALYRAKSLGRARTEVVQLPPPGQSAQQPEPPTYRPG